MHFDERVELVISGAILLSVLTTIYNLPNFLMDIYTILIPSFLVSGLLYTMFIGVGLDFLADIKVAVVCYPVSLLTVAVFITKLGIM